MPTEYLQNLLLQRLKQLGLDFSTSGISTQQLSIPVGENLQALYKGYFFLPAAMAYFEETLTGLSKRPTTKKIDLIYCTL